MTQVFEYSPYEIIALDSNDNEIGQITQFTKLDLLIKHNDVGKWKFDGAAGDFDLLTWNGRVKIKRLGALMFTGYMTEYHYEIDDNGYEKIDVVGVCENGYLDRALAYPVPSGPPYNQEFDTQLDVAETVLKYFVNVNIGPAAMIARQVKNLVVAPDLGRGIAVKGEGRFQELLELLQSLCLNDNESMFRILDKTFEYYPVTDKTATVEFSKELRNIRSLKWSIKAPKSNYIIVGGSGTGSTRTFWEGMDVLSVSRYGRYEKFSNKSNSSDFMVLQQEVDKELVKDADVFKLELDVIDIPGMRLHTDYWIGDKIRTYIRHQHGSAVVSDYVDGIVQEIKITFDDKGERIEPTISSPYEELRFLPTLFDEIRKLDQRLGLVERA